MSFPVASETQPAYRPDIDGLRAVAILGVLVFHCFPSWMPGGFAGVDVFFVISGYLITSILFADCQKGRFSLLRFYARRIRRIFPALLVCLGASWALGYALLTPSEFKELARSVVHSAYFANNFLLVSQAGYFDTHADLKPLLHLWSLAVEEQFYIVWPWVIFLAVRLAAYGRWLIALLGVSSLIASIVATNTQPIQAFFLPHFRAWELIAGAATAVWLASPVRNALGRWLAPLGLVLIAFAYVGFSGSDPFPGWRAMLPVGGACLILAAPHDETPIKRWLANRYLVAIGLISYPLYLWHWVLLSYTRILFETPTAWLIGGIGLLSVLLAWATYRFIEMPLRHGRFGTLHPRTVPIACLVLLLALGGLGDHTRRMQGLPQRLSGTDWQDLLWPASQVLDTACQQDLKPAGDYCMRSHPGPATHILLGDSHANHFFPGLSRRIAARGGNLLQLQGPLKTASDPAWQNVDALVQRHDIQTIYIAYHQGRMKEADNPFGAVLETTISRLLKAGQHVVFIVDNPEFDFDPRLNIQRPPLAEWLAAGQKREGALTESLDYQHRKRSDYNDYLGILQQLFPQLRILDTFSPLCNANGCSALHDGKLLFRDRHHLTYNGSIELFERIDPSADARQ